MRLLSTALGCAVLAAGCGRLGFDSEGLGDEPDAALDAILPITERSFGDRPDAEVADVTVDTSVIEGEPADNCGACDRIFGGGTEVGLLRFDLSSLAGSNVTVVEMSVELWLAGPHTLGGTNDIYIVREPWDEGAQLEQNPGVANWDERQEGVPWTSVGVGPGSRDADPIFTGAPISLEDPYIIPIPTVTAQQWVDAPDENHGIAIVGRDYPGPGGDHPHFVSSENASQLARRPLLRLRYR